MLKQSMRITLINQTFYPDVVSTAQHLKDLALWLTEAGHDVTVVASRRAYDNPQKMFPKIETWRGIRIARVTNTGFGKRSKLTRMVDFGTFILACCWKLLWLPRQNLVVALTSPPIISFIGALFVRIRGGRFCYWVMDLNPDEAVAAGWLNPHSLAAKWLEACSRFSMRTADKIVVLDEFMRERILKKGIPGEKIMVVPPWSHDSEVSYDAAGRARFRQAHGLEDKFVVMYAGNHSPCHPLDTVMLAAKKLSARSDIMFCFVGGGSEFKRVKAFAETNSLTNVLCLPYQPLEQLAGSLSAADLHVVAMGNPFVGIVHPCKIYNIMLVGAPLLYVGPKPSHISRILDEIGPEMLWATAGHGGTDEVTQHILRIKEMNSLPHRNGSARVLEKFSSRLLVPRLGSILEAPNPER
jgi:glycosyltransferase involved in cell wall biosynthesis